MKKIIDSQDWTTKNDLLKPAKVGDMIEGRIITQTSGKLFLDLSPFKTGVIYGQEFYQAKEQLKDLKIGDKILVKIIDLESEEGYLELSIRDASKELAWETLKQKREKGELLKVKISGANKGGLLSEIFGLQAFLPVSQLLPDHYPKVEGGDTMKILRELQKFIGQELEVKIFNLEEKGRGIILSEKAKEVEKIKEILKNYQIGDVVEGEIGGITDFGAFMKFSAFTKVSADESASAKASADKPASAKTSEDKGRELEGLIHISELDWKMIDNPSEIVKIGQKVKAKIIDIANDKVSLSLKSLKKDPWQNIEKKYKKGDLVSGRVTKFNPFGVFIQITPAIQGLCHISEFGLKSKMEEKLKMGKKYNFQILEIRPEEHRMSLKLVEK